MVFPQCVFVCVCVECLLFGLACRQIYTHTLQRCHIIKRLMVHGNPMKLNNIRHVFVVHLPCAVSYLYWSNTQHTCTIDALMAHYICIHVGMAFVAQLSYAHSNHKLCLIFPPLRRIVWMLSSCLLFVRLFGFGFEYIMFLCCANKIGFNLLVLVTPSQRVS